MSDNRRYHEARRVTLIGAASNASLGILKIITGILYHSHALVADGLHSLADLLTDVMVLVASRLGSLDPDSTHPYGHQRFETAGTLFLALLLVLVGAGIVWDSFDHMLQASDKIPGVLALPVAIASILANEFLYHYTLYIGKKINSSLLKANAWHHRSDAGASVVVVLGLIATLLGYTWFDALAALIVGLLIIKMGLHYGWDSVKELVDTAVSPEFLKEIETRIQSVNGVVKLHQLRTRQMGSDVYIDVHIQVNSWISVSEGHYIAQHVHYALKNSFAQVKDVTVHVDPEDDEVSAPSLHLPNRIVLEQGSFVHLKTAFPGNFKTGLHYLDGKLTMDILMFDSMRQKPNDESIRQYLTEHPEIQRIQFFSCECVYIQEA